MTKHSVSDTIHTIRKRQKLFLVINILIVCIFLWVVFLRQQSTSIDEIFSYVWPDVDQVIVFTPQKDLTQNPFVPAVLQQHIDDISRIVIVQDSQKSGSSDIFVQVKKPLESNDILRSFIQQDGELTRVEKKLSDNVYVYTMPDRADMIRVYPMQEGFWKDMNQKDLSALQKSDMAFVSHPSKQASILSDPMLRTMVQNIRYFLVTAQGNIETSFAIDANIIYMSWVKQPDRINFSSKMPLSSESMIVELWGMVSLFSWVINFWALPQNVRASLDERVLMQVYQTDTLLGVGLTLTLSGTHTYDFIRNTWSVLWSQLQNLLVQSLGTGVSIKTIQENNRLGFMIPFGARPPFMLYATTQSGNSVIVAGTPFFGTGEQKHDFSSLTNRHTIARIYGDCTSLRKNMQSVFSAFATPGLVNEEQDRCTDRVIYGAVDAYEDRLKAVFHLEDR